MKLIERDGFLSVLQSRFEQSLKGEGHCIFVAGEAGIGKTSLVNSFCRDLQEEYNIYQGTCDALFTPRPLAPLYDILLQLGKAVPDTDHNITDRTTFFSRIFYELQQQKKTSLIIFEDIHWADEATLDFIKFLARRITQLSCLFILTYRDNEIYSGHPLRNVLGQLNADSFTRIHLEPLSREAVDILAEEKGYPGSAIYHLSGGNPFYVNELLANYNKGLPDNIKDSIIDAFNRQEEKPRQVWELLSVIPTSFEVKYLEKFEPLYAAAIERCMESKILLLKDGHISFKHELFRRTIESSLSPLRRVSLNKKILDLLKESFEQNKEIERIIHHAKNANEYESVSYYAPLAAGQAAAVGAHIEASRLYLTAIEYYQGNDKDILVQLYESYAYECYLTNQVKEAIIYTGKALAIWKEKNNAERSGNSMRFLSRLWWFDDNSKNAQKFAEQAIEAFKNEPSSPAKAMAYSNMSQLKMLFDEIEECIAWGEKAIAMAKELGDEKTLSHALNNVGSVYMYMPSLEQQGIELLQQSLDIALKNGFPEHTARAYSNLGNILQKLKKYDFATSVLDEGIRFAEERNLDSSRAIMLSLKSTLLLDTGDWESAYAIADNLLKNENYLSAFTIFLLPVAGTIKMRRGDADALPLLLEAYSKAFDATELQRIIPSLVALLEYEWLTGKTFIKTEDLERSKEMIAQSIYTIEKSEFAFWLKKARKEHLILSDPYEGYDISTVKKAQKAAAHWEKIGSPYAQALALFEGNEDDKRNAIKMVHELGASAVYEKMKLEMRMAGIKSIPRGIRKSTQANAALLTEREMGVLLLLQEGLQNKEIAASLYISAKTVDHHISSILYKLEAKSRTKAVQESIRLGILK